MPHLIDCAKAIAAIEDRRKQHGISIVLLTRTANIGLRYYHRLISGRRGANKRTIRHLRLALSRLSIGRSDEIADNSLVIYAMIRMAVAMICHERGIDAELIQRENPNKKATASKEWAEAALIRNEAWSLVSNAFGIKQVDIGHAAGVTRSAVKQALNRIEDMRDDPDYEQFHDRLERALTGGGW